MCVASCVTSTLRSNFLYMNTKATDPSFHIAEVSLCIEVEVRDQVNCP